MVGKVFIPKYYSASDLKLATIAFEDPCVKVDCIIKHDNIIVLDAIYNKGKHLLVGNEDYVIYMDNNINQKDIITIEFKDPGCVNMDCYIHNNSGIVVYRAE